MRLVHIASVAEWDDARRAGRYERSTLGRALADVGFIHLATAAQLPGVLAAYYTGVDPDDLVLLIVDPQICAAAGSPLRWESVPHSPVSFPHIYGAIPVDAVVDTARVARAPGGDWQLPDLASAGVRSDPPTDGTADSQTAGDGETPGK